MRCEYDAASVSTSRLISNSSMDCNNSGIVLLDMGWTQRRDAQRTYPDSRFVDLCMTGQQECATRRTGPALCRSMHYASYKLRHGLV